jgi:hypothetical protein
LHLLLLLQSKATIAALLLLVLFPSAHQLHLLYSPLRKVCYCKVCCCRWPLVLRSRHVSRCGCSSGSVSGIKLLVYEA